MSAERGADEFDNGSFEQPWKTLAFATLRLRPGDCLLVEPGFYDETRETNDGGVTRTVFVREIGPEEDNFPFLPIVSTADRPTVICAASRVRPRIFGNFDVRGAFVELRDLVILGDAATSDEEGIGVFESHNITVSNCLVANHGGGGIQFNQSDVVVAEHNVCVNNARTNPSQQSGISSFQPVVRTDTDEPFGVVFRNNLCIGNRNTVPNADDNITDGNGIVLDDHAYTQFSLLLGSILAGDSDPTQSSGAPRIDMGEQAELLPYGRRSLVSQNLCLRNGGRGIQVFQTDDVAIRRNLCLFNNRSPETIADLPRDMDGNPFFVFGEITVQESTHVTVARNTAIAFGRESAAASELFDPPGSPSTNRWRRNLLFNFVRSGPLVSVANNDDSDLLDFLD